VHETPKRFTRTFAPLLLTIGVLGTAACGSGASSTEAFVTPSHAAHGTSAANEIVIKLIVYRPDDLAVPSHTKVTWKQTDAGFHTVTSGTVTKDASGSVEQLPDGTFASGKLATNKTFAFTFEESGTYPFFCEIHPATMSGRVSVE
jgi:plastocyanin